MNQNMMLIALLIGGLFFLRGQPRRDWSGWRGVPGQMETVINGGATGIPGIPGTTGFYGEG